jgi:4-diphosphocytidyl-2-C-methyl-D-erythritol kinase
MNRLRAHAKINVFLRVKARRDDGYHDIESVVLPVSLHDLVTVDPAEELSVSILGAPGDLLGDEENLALVAARALSQEAGSAALGARISIDKRIPIAAGLGGGSADAAATLHALNRLWDLGMSDAALAAVGADVGSDVPALVAGGPRLVLGRGEVIHPVFVAPTHWVLALMPFAVSTPDAYMWWDEDGSTGPDPGALIAALETGDLELLGSALYDDLWTPVASRHPRLQAKADALNRAGALGVVMTGSGPTLAALAGDAAHAGRLAKAVEGCLVVSAPAAAFTDVGPGEAG